MNERLRSASTGLLIVLVGVAAASSNAARCPPASSRAFTGTEIDAPFFVFDGGSQGVGLGQFDTPSAIAAVHEGNRTLIAVSDTGNHRIKMMTAQGYFQDFWGGRGTKPGWLTAPAGLAASPAGDLWVVDAGNHRLQKLHALREEVAAVTGKPLTVVGRRGKGAGEFENPSGVAVDSRGDLYVTDTGNHRIQKLTPRGKPAAIWGGRGTAPGRFESPTGIAVGPGDVIYVADTGNHRIQSFDRSGKPLRQWGAFGGAAGQLSAPRGLAVDAKGNLYVADSGNDRIQKLDREGRPLGAVGCSGTAEGELRRPVAVALDLEGYLYVVEEGNHRVQKLGPQ